MLDISCESSAGRRFTLNIMAYFSEIKKDDTQVVSAAVLIGALRVKINNKRDNCNPIKRHRSDCSRT